MVGYNFRLFFMLMTLFFLRFPTAGRPQTGRRRSGIATPGRFHRIGPVYGLFFILPANSTAFILVKQQSEINEIFHPAHNHLFLSQF